MQQPLPWTISPWPHNLSQQASGNPGAVQNIPGRPDLVFPKFNAVVFVHGCFWHRHVGCRYTTTPSTDRSSGTPSSVGTWLETALCGLRFSPTDGAYRLYGSAHYENPSRLKQRPTFSLHGYGAMLRKLRSLERN